MSEVADLPAGSAVDLACGEGRNAVWLAERGWKVTGVDFSSVGLAKAQRLAGSRHVDVRWVESAVGEWRAPSGGSRLDLGENQGRAKELREECEMELGQRCCRRCAKAPEAHRRAGSRRGTHAGRGSGMPRGGGPVVAATKAFEQAGFKLVASGLVYCVEHPEQAEADGYASKKSNVCS